MDNRDLDNLEIQEAFDTVLTPFIGATINNTNRELIGQALDRATTQALDRATTHVFANIINRIEADIRSVFVHPSHEVWYNEHVQRPMGLQDLVSDNPTPRSWGEAAENSRREDMQTRWVRFLDLLTMSLRNNYTVMTHIDRPDLPANEDLRRTILEYIRGSLHAVNINRLPEVLRSMAESVYDLVTRRGWDSSVLREALARFQEDPGNSLPMERFYGLICDNLDSFLMETGGSNSTEEYRIEVINRIRHIVESSRAMCDIYMDSETVSLYSERLFNMIYNMLNWTVDDVRRCFTAPVNQYREGPYVPRYVVSSTENSLSIEQPVEEGKSEYVLHRKVVLQENQVARVDGCLSQTSNLSVVEVAKYFKLVLIPRDANVPWMRISFRATGHSIIGYTWKEVRVVVQRKYAGKVGVAIEVTNEQV